MKTALSSADPGHKDMRSILATAATFISIVLAPPGAAQPCPFPDPLPDLSHPSSPHRRMFSPYGGALDRPLLVIYLHFTDAPEPPGWDTAWARQKFFGPGFPNVAGWYQANSFGKLTLFPASESEGTANDGVVSVEGGTIADYNALLPDEGAMNRRLLELADPYVDFAAFDTNGDGTVTSEELVVVNLRVHYDVNQPGPDDDDQRGANRGICDGTPSCPTVSMDGKTIDKGFRFVMGLHAESFATWTHEIAHTVLDLADLYAYGVGALDIGGPTLGSSQTWSFSTSAWSKLHWGWIQPTIVTKDGFYDVPKAYDTGTAYVLYDVTRGTNDYFIVENRRPTQGTYDKDAPDDGLVIWRIDDAQFNSASARPIEIMRADGVTTPQCTPGCYGGSNGDAWNPADSATPQRTMSRPWRDGTASNVAVRAIGEAGNTVQAYFDVCGPGVLVDTYPVDAEGPPKVVAGALQTTRVPVMNTGEVSDTFEFSFSGLPPGWTAVSRTVTLAPGVETLLDLDFTPAHDHPEGIVTVSVSGIAPNVGTSQSVDLEVVHVSDLAILGIQVDGEPAESVAGGSHSVTVRVRVTNLGPSWPTDATLTGTASASTGSSVTPASWTRHIPALQKDEVREISDVFQISCQAPGQHSHTFAVEIAPTLAEENDIFEENNSAQVTVTTECIAPVAVNIRPGSFSNQVNPKSKGVIPVAVLTTAAGEYGLPLAFEASTIDPLSVRFGRPALLQAGGGASEADGSGHVEDALELDEVTRDGDLDMVLHFPVQATDPAEADVEGCVRGEFVAADGVRLKFFGCGSMSVKSNDILAQHGPAVTAASGDTIHAGGASSVEEPQVAVLPGQLRAAPNPFHTSVDLRFGLPVTEEADVRVYDLSGRLVRRVFTGTLGAGEQRVTWDGRKDGGRVVGQGLYVVRVQAGSRVLSTMILRRR